MICFQWTTLNLPGLQRWRWVKYSHFQNGMDRLTWALGYGGFHTRPLEDALATPEAATLRGQLRVDDPDSRREHLASDHQQRRSGAVDGVCQALLSSRYSRTRRERFFHGAG